jgi:sarcosine oxidase, subunit gamma
VTRTSPVHECLRLLHTEWSELNGMPVARRIANAASSALQLFDLSALRRTGLKGSGAADWLQARGVAVPERANSWSALTGEGIVARLGRGEFLLEDGWHGTVAAGIELELAPAANVYPVLRQDAALMMRGEAAHEVLAQTCSIDVLSMPPQERAVALTMMAGITVTLIDVSAASAVPCFRVWCDGTYGTYLWETLLGIAVELGGNAAGLETLHPGLQAAGNTKSNQA